MARGLRTSALIPSRASHGRWRPSCVAGLLVVVLPACGPEGRSPHFFSEYEQPLTGSESVARAQLWVNAMVPYCQSPNGQPDPDTSCSAVCMRPMNSQWDPYRSDCSGFVSWAWDLPPPGRTTDQFAPAVTDITEAIDGNALEPGDALNIPGDHMILFVSWVEPGVSANFMEEPGCSSEITYAHAFTSNVEISGATVSVDYEGTSFTAIRYLGLTGLGDAGTITVPDAGVTTCSVTSLGTSGECLLTTDCASMGRTSTPGDCPGPDDIQCCTGLPSPSCATNSDCSGATPICDTSTGQCRGCSSDSDCSQGVCATSSTDPSEGRCVECTPSAGCTRPYQCNPATDTCVQCLSNTDCPADLPTCSATNMCVCAGVCDEVGTDAGPVFQLDAGSAPHTAKGGCAMVRPDASVLALLMIAFGARRRRTGLG